MLDVGCGCGDYLFEIKNIIERGKGIDYNTYKTSNNELRNREFYPGIFFKNYSKQMCERNPHENVNYRIKNEVFEFFVVKIPKQEIVDEIGEGV